MNGHHDGMGKGLGAALPSVRGSRYEESDLVGQRTLGKTRPSELKGEGGGSLVQPLSLSDKKEIQSS